MTSGLGSVRGQIRIDAKQAIAEYAALRAANLSTRTSLLASAAVFAKVGVVALAAAAPIVLLFKKAISAAADFEKKIDFFGAVTNASQEDMQAVADKAIDMSRTTVFSATQMADAFVEFGKAGISTRDILDGVAESTANLAQAAAIDMPAASNIIVSTMKTFNIAAADSAHIADVLAGAANASIIDIEDIAYSLKYAGGIAAATKIPFESLTTAIALLGNAGIRGSTAGTSLRQIMVSLTSQTPKATEVLKKLGIITKNNTNLFIDQQGHLKPLDQIFQILQDHTRGLTDAQRLAATKTIFNSRALAAANILLKDGAAGFAKMNAEISKTSAADVAAKRLDNLAGDTQRLKNAIQTMLIQAGGPLQDFMRSIVKSLTAAVRWFGNLSEGQQKAIIYTLAGVAAFLILVGTLSLMISAVLMTVRVYKDLRLALMLVRTAAIKPLITALRALMVSLLTNPVFLIIAAIVALGIAFIVLWKRSETFRKIVMAVLHAVANAAKAVANAFVTAFDAIIKAAKATARFFQAVWAGIQKWIVDPVVGAFKAVVSAIKTAGRAISSAFSAIVGFVQRHWKQIMTIIALFLGPLALAIALIVDIVTTNWDWIKTHTIAVWNAIWNIIKGIITILVSIFNLYFNTIKTIVLTVWNAIQTASEAVWNAIVAILTPIINALVAFFTIQFNAIKFIITTVWNAVRTASVTAWNAIKAVLTPIVNGIRNVITTAFNATRSAVTTAWNGIASLLQGVYNNTISRVITAIKTAVSGIATVIDSLQTTWHRVWTAVSDTIRSVWNGPMGEVLHFLEGILNRISSVMGAISGAIGKVTGAAKSAGGFVGKVTGLFGSGGWVPGGKNEIGGLVHGQEYVLSTDMLAGRQKIDPGVMAKVLAGQRISAHAASLDASRSISNRTAGAKFAPSASTPVNLRVFIGDRELTDLVRVEIDEAFAPLGPMTKAGAV